MKTHTSNFKEQIKLLGREIDSKITFGDTVLGENDLNAVTPSYQGAILKSVMKQLDIDSNVEIPIGTVLKYEFGLKVNGEYEYINYGNYVVYSIEKQEDTGSYKIVCYDKLLYSMLEYVKLPITYPISIRDYINAISTTLGLKFANKSGTFANYDKQIQADLYDGIGYTFRDVLDELAQVTASTICLNENDELEIRYIKETNDVIDEEFLKDVNVNFGEKFGKVNTIVLSRSGDSDSVYYPSTLPANPYEIKISDNQIMNGNDRADFLRDIYDKLNGLEFYTNDFVLTGICYYDLCDRYSVKIGDTTYSCVMLNDEVLVTQGLEENVYTEMPEQTETDYKHASKDDRMINQVYIIAKKNEAEILAVVNTTKEIQKEINPTKNESGSEIIIEDASNNPLINLEIEGKSTQETRSGKNLLNIPDQKTSSRSVDYVMKNGLIIINGTSTEAHNLTWNSFQVDETGEYTFSITLSKILSGGGAWLILQHSSDNTSWSTTAELNFTGLNRSSTKTLNKELYYRLRIYVQGEITFSDLIIAAQLEKGSTVSNWEPYGVSPSPDYPSEIESVGYENLFNPSNVVSGYTNDNNGVISGNGVSTGYIEIKGGQKYYILANKTSGNWGAWYDENKTFISGITLGANIDGVVYAPLGAKYMSFTVSYSNNNPDYASNVMIVQSDKSLLYIPYGKYGIEVKTVGRNIWNEQWELGTINANTGEAITVTTRIRSKNFINVKSNTKYYGRIPSTVDNCLIVYYDNAQAYIKSSYIYSDSYEFTTPSNCKYIKFTPSSNYGTTYNNDICINISDDKNGEYAPYKSNTSLVVLNQQLRSLPNGVKDIAYIRNNKLYVDRYIGSRVFNGSEEWTVNNKNSPNFALVIDNLGGSEVSTDFNSLMSNKLTISNHNSSYQALQDNIVATLGGTTHKIYIRIDETVNTVALLKTWLSNNNLQVDYELVTPVTEELGEIKIPSTFEGVNNITTTDELLPIINLTYVRDTQIANYVEEHMAQIKINEDNIRLEVSKKIGSDEVVSSINQSAEQITLKSNRVVIESDNFTLDKDGTITAKAGEIAGFNATEEGFYYLLQPKKNYTQDDIDKLGAYIYQGASLTEEEKELYDVNNDGVLNLIDMQTIAWTIVNNISNSMPGKLQILLPKKGQNPFVLNFGFYNGYGELLNGFTYDRATFLNTEINGNLTVTGSKNRIVNIGNKNILLNAYETASPYFGDIGSSKTDENGYCKIEIEQLFSQTIEDDDYKVFIQKCGQGDLYVIKHKKYFEVKGTPNLDFDWEIKAIQKGFKNIRLQEKER